MAAEATVNLIINVAAICESLRKSSYNRGLLQVAMEISKESIEGIKIEYVDISTICEADCFIFASPEYNYSITAPLKNAIDWASRPPNCWGDKAAAIISTGGAFGGRRSQYHLRHIGVYIDLHFINKPEFLLKAFEPPAKFDSDGNLIDLEAKERLEELLASLYAFTLRLKGKC